MSMTFTVAVTLDWSDGSDLALYGRNETANPNSAADTVYSGNVGPHDGLTYSDAGGGTPPETITGTFTADTTFKFWRNQPTTDFPENDITGGGSGPDIQTIVIHNTGSTNIYVNSLLRNPGQTRTFTSMAYAGYGNGFQTAYLSGTQVIVEAGPVCWELTAMRRNGKWFRDHGPGRLPSEIRVPLDVVPNTSIVYEDGVLVPRSWYKIKHVNHWRPGINP